MKKMSAKDFDKKLRLLPKNGQTNGERVNPTMFYWKQTIFRFLYKQTTYLQRLVCAIHDIEKFFFSSTWSFRLILPNLTIITLFIF